MMPGFNAPPEELLAGCDDDVEVYVDMLINDKPMTTPTLMVLALNASKRSPELLALYFATTLQKLAACRWSDTPDTATTKGI